MKEEKVIRDIMYQYIDEYVDFFEFWCKGEKQELEKSIKKSINTLDLSLYIDTCLKQKEDLLNGKLSIKKEITSNNSILMGNFKKELREKFLKKNDNKVLFERIYLDYFSQFSSDELLNNRSKEGRKISKGLKSIPISQEELRLFQDCYSEIVQENKLTDKENIIIEASVRPIDFLMMSYNGKNEWTTCQSIIDGEKGYGPLEYMTDNSSIVIQAYLKSEENKLIKKKLWRCLGFLSQDKNVLTLSTQYPYKNNVLQTEAFNLFKKDKSVETKTPLVVKEDGIELTFNTDNNNFVYCGDDDISFCDYAKGNFSKTGVPTLFINSVDKEFKTYICQSPIDVATNPPFDNPLFYSEDMLLSPTVGLLNADLIIDNL